MPDLPPVAEDVISRAQAYVDDEAASEDPQSLVAGLLAVIDLIDPCPHIRTEGTIDDGHHYVSTACWHATHQPDLTDEQREQLHARCRRVCKWCETGCACGCGHPSGDSQ